MAAPYLDPAAAASRLSGFGITAEVSERELMVASDQLDALAPFAGSKPYGQERQFPRAGEDAVPDAVLDWVALRAYELSSEEEPPVTSERAGSVSRNYGRAKISRTARLRYGLLDRYLLRTGIAP